MKGVGICFGIYSYCFDIKFLAGTDDAYGNFPAIGDEDTLEHRDYLLIYIVLI